MEMERKRKGKKRAKDGGKKCWSKEENRIKHREKK